MFWNSGFFQQVNVNLLVLITHSIAMKMSHLVLIWFCSSASTSRVPEEAEQGFECIFRLHLNISRCVVAHYKITSIPIKKWGGYQGNHGWQCSCWSVWEQWTSHSPSLSVLWCIRHLTKTKPHLASLAHKLKLFLYIAGRPNFPASTVSLEFERE